MCGRRHKKQSVFSSRKIWISRTSGSFRPVRITVCYWCVCACPDVWLWPHELRTCSARRRLNRGLVILCCSLITSYACTAPHAEALWLGGWQAELATYDVPGPASIAERGIQGVRIRKSEGGIPRTERR